MGGFEHPLIDEAGIPFDRYDEVRAGPLHGVGLARVLVSLAQLGLGTLQSIGLLTRHRPQALLLTGGWVGFPVALAAWLFRIPGMIYLPDIEPGLTIRLLSRFARRIALTVEESKVYFPGRDTVVTGYPLRREVQQATQEQAITHFKLDANRKTLLVFGGSRGSRAINYALLNILPELLREEVQVIHVTGTLDWPDIEKRHQAMPDPTRYHAFPYLHHEMGLAMAAADLVVCRAGASVLGEFPFFGLPSILIPLAYVWRYQKVNAHYLASRGAAIHMDENRVEAELLPTIRDLFNNPKRLTQMRESARGLAQLDGAIRAAEQLAQLAGAQA